MAKHFIGIWLIYWAAVLLLPVHSIYPSTFAAAFLQAGFVALVLLGIACLRIMVEVRSMPPAGRFDIPAARDLTRIAIAMSVIGLVSLIYDKAYVQGIDYSEGVAVAREEWRQLGEERGAHVSSAFSVLGYLIGSAYYVAIVLAITQPGALTVRQRLWTLLAGFGLMMGNSIITGGRSNLLLLAAFVVGAFVSRRGLTFSTVVPVAMARRMIKVVVLLGLAYGVFIFYERARAGEVEVLEYAIEFLPFLGLEPSQAYRDSLNGGVLSSLSALLVLTFSYVTHSFATVAAIVDAPNEHKTIIFLHVASLLSKLGVTGEPDGDWFLSGRLPSVPGSLWHQFGLAGFLVGSWLIGMAAEACRIWAARHPRRLLPLGAFVMAYATLILTPVLFAGDFLSSPFVLGSFLQLALVDAWLRSLKRARRRFTQTPAVSPQPL
ncbi:MAG: oligosaccharide repeat unit polymerase [Ideonella sp.]|nr:MAG: oligosaccharide repeat unit polymerase [Burkholderiaceae bacterium]MBE7426228.1 oligosaccharide repeat unit polymerase [Ideonella sp.]